MTGLISQNCCPFFAEDLLFFSAFFSLFAYFSKVPKETARYPQPPGPSAGSRSKYTCEKSARSE